MQLSKLFSGTDVVYGKELVNLDVGGVSYDTRRIKKGDVFVATCGTNVDSSKFAFEAEKKGAIVYVGEKIVSGLHIPQLLTANSRRTLAFAYANFLSTWKPSGAEIFSFFLFFPPESLQKILQNIHHTPWLNFSFI